MATAQELFDPSAYGSGREWAYVPDPVVNKLGSSPKVSFTDYTKAVFDSQTILGAAAENIAFYSAVKLGTESDPNYNPFNDPFIRAEDRRYFLDSRSAGESAIIAEKLRREREARDIVKAEGLTGRVVAGSIIAYGPEMLAMGLAGKYLGAAAKFATGGAVAAEGAGLATKIAMGVGTNLAQEALGEAIKQAGQYERGWDETAWNLVGAGVIGGMIPVMGAGMKAVLNRNQTARLAREMEPGIIEATTDALSTGSKESLDVLGDAGSVLEGKPYEMAKPTGTLTADWSGSAPFIKGLTPNQRRFRWTVKDVSDLLGELLTYGKLTKGGVDDAVENRINALWLGAQRQADIKKFRLYESYVKDHGIGIQERALAGFGEAGPIAKNRAQFEDEVGRYIQFGADENVLKANGINPDKHILEAAKIDKQLYENAAKEINGVGLAEDLQTPAGSYGYFPRIPHAKKLTAKGVQFVNDVAPYIQLEEHELAAAMANGISPEAMQREIAEKVRMKYLGISGDQIGAGGRALHERTLTNVPDDVLRPYMLTRADEVSRIYMQKIGRRVELARKATVTARVGAMLDKIAELETQVGAGTITKAQALEMAKGYELEARNLVEGFTGKTAFGGPEGVRQQLKDYVDEAARQRSGEISKKYADERAAVDLAFSRKMKDIRTDAATDAEMARFDFDAQKMATKEDTANEAIRLADEYQKAVDDIRTRQEGELFQESLTARKDVADTVQRISEYHDTLKSMKSNLDKLNVGEAKNVDELISELDAIDPDMIDPETANLNLQQVISDYNAEKNLSRNVTDALRALRDTEKQSLGPLREAVKAVDRKARLFAAAKNLEGNLQNNDLITEFFKAKGEYLSSLAEAKGAGKSAIEGLEKIRDMKIADFRNARDEQLQPLREALGMFHKANSGLLKEDMKALRESVNGVRQQVNEALGQRAAAFRLFNAKTKLASLRRIEAQAMLNPDTWADKLDPAFLRRKTDIQAAAQAGTMTADAANKAISALDMEHSKAKEEVRNSVQMILGSFGHDRDNSLISRFASFMRAWSYTTKMGKMMVTNAVDVPQPMLKLGWAHGIKGYKAYLGTIGAEGEQQAVRDTFRAIAGGMEGMHADRAMALLDMNYSELNRTAGETAMEFMANKMGKATGFSYLNDMTKTAAGFSVSDFIHRVAPRQAAGKATTVEQALMRSWGIDDQFAKEIAARDAWKDFHAGVKVPDFDRLPKAAADRISMAINTAVDTTVVTPRLGQVALAQRTWWGKALFQFKSFMVAQQESTLSFIEAKLREGTGLEKASAGAAVAAMLGTGAGAVYLKGWAAGDTEQYTGDLNKWFADSVDQSGVTGLFMEANNLLENVTGKAGKDGEHRIGFRPLIGVDEGSYRYRDVDVGGFIAGPAGDLGQSLYDGALGGSAALLSGEQMTAFQAKQMMKLVPFNNVFWLTTMPYSLADFGGNLTGAFDLPDTREEMAVSMGAKPSKKRKKRF